MFSEKIRILVLDDDPIVIMSAERVLMAEGYHVDGILSGKEAMHSIELNEYDLVLTDLKMLEADGLNLIKWLRQFRPSTAIVVVTGYLLQETIKEALKLGVHDHVMKPFTPAVLKDVVKKTLDWMKVNTREKDIERAFPREMLDELDASIQDCRSGTCSTEAVLLTAQRIFGYLPCSIQKRIAGGLGIFPSEIQSIVSSKPFFRTRQAGDHTIKVCACTECYVKGGERVLNGIKDTLKIEVGQTTRDGKFTLEAGRCVHACGRGPVIAVDRNIHPGLTPRKAIDIVHKYVEPVAETI